MPPRMIISPLTSIILAKMVVLRGSVLIILLSPMLICSKTLLSNNMNKFKTIFSKMEAKQLAKTYKRTTFSASLKKMTQTKNLRGKCLLQLEKGRLRN
jgi:hypothetical protein